MSSIVKRSVSIHGHRTSFSLEQSFHEELAAIAAERDMALAALVGEIDEARPEGVNLSSALRLHVLAQLKSRLAETTKSLPVRTEHTQQAVKRQPSRRQVFD